MESVSPPAPVRTRAYRKTLAASPPGRGSRSGGIWSLWVVVGLRVGSGMLAVAAVAHVLVHMLVDTVAAVVLGLGLVHVPVLVVAEDMGAGILAAGRMVVACLVGP